ncbi:MAG: FMN-binding glutamate synthase family protein [Acidimicrobiales bacterium]|nr:FMN-binding glutamate synthase family protein [Acidimicrobiales bacterium]
MVWLFLLVLVISLAGLALYDLLQRQHAVLRNFPIIGHLRYILEAFGPELRQYVVTDNDDERPFSRDQRRWIYASAKRQNNLFGFGTDNNLEQANDYLVIKHVAFPITAPENEPLGPGPDLRLPCAKVLGGYRRRAKAFRPTSIVNISGMSFGSLSGAAVEAINRGVLLDGCWQNTGEGGLSRHHLHGGDLVFQIGTGYFGCRDENGRFDLERLVDTVAAHPQIRAIEIKLSQGAKPGLGGVLPAAKVSPEIAQTRGVPVGVEVRSPSRHTAFSDVDSMLAFVETIADRTGLPVGIKSAVGSLDFWRELAQRIEVTGQAVDFITIDGGEGGTGAAPLVFADHVSLPFRWAFARVYREFAQRGVHNNVVWIGSGKLGLPENGLLALALGCDLLAVGREAMFAIGCIQAQRCHTGRCPSGVATQSQWLQRGLDPELKSVRLANYLATFRYELLRLAQACGHPHPSLVRLSQLEALEGRFQAVQLDEVFQYEPGWGLPPEDAQQELRRLMGAD